MPLIANPNIFISAGEFSGDLLAADLVHQLRLEFPLHTFVGVTGPAMRTAGVRSLATTDELSVMGVIEVARRAADIRQLEQRLLVWIDRLQPKFAVLVDFPGFHFRLAEQLKLRGIPVFQYVAPKVWAWGKARTAWLKRDFTKVIGVLPFEESFFREHGVNYSYVGSPHWDRMSKVGGQANDLGLPGGVPVVAFLPGSRLSEIRRILPEMLKIRKELKKIMPDAICVIPLASSLDEQDVWSTIGSPDLGVAKANLGFLAADFYWVKGWSLEVMKIARAAVVASGTATLECALAGTPMTVVYVMNDLSFAIAKRAVKIRWASLVNLLMNEEVVKEHLQTIHPEVVAAEIADLVRESPARKHMLQKFHELAAKLEPGASRRAARIIRETMTELSTSGPTFRGGGI